MRTYSPIRRYVLVLLGLLPLCSLCLTSCKDDLDLYEAPQVTVSPTFPDNTILFDEGGGSKTISIQTNRQWTISLGDTADWLSVSPTQGEEGNYSVTLEVLPNQGDAREVQMIIKTSTRMFVYLVSQKSVTGQAITYTSLDKITEMGQPLDRNGKTIEEDIRIRATITTDYHGKQFPFQGYHHIQDAEGNAIVLTVPRGEEPLSFGDQVTAKLKGAKLSNYNGTIQVEVSHANMVIVPNQPIEPVVTTIEEILAGKHVNQYVRLQEVQFVEYGIPFFSGTYSSYRHKIQDKTGREVQLDVWKTATFGGDLVPEGSGTITGVATINVNSSGKTFYNIRPSLRTDMKLDQLRFTPSTGGDTPAPEPTGGNIYGVDLTQSPLESLIEDFSNAGEDKTPVAIAGWLNKSVVGSRNFQKRSHNGVHYAQGTAFGTKEPQTRFVLVTPRLSMTAGANHSLEYTYSTGHTNGATLTIQLLGSKGEVVKNLKVINADDSPSGYGNQHYKETISVLGAEDSGYIAFLYEGTPERSTTYQIEEIKFTK